jgi:multisubunit Na+/H+ antiporter MnhF subunit
MKYIPLMRSSQDFYNFIDRTIFPILLHILVIHNAYQYYITRDESVPTELLRANLSICVMLALYWYETRAPDNIHTKVCYAIIIVLACLGFLHTVADFSRHFRAWSTAFSISTVVDIRPAASTMSSGRSLLLASIAI